MFGHIYVAGTNLVEGYKVILNTIYIKALGVGVSDKISRSAFFRLSNSGLENSMLGPVMDCTTPFKSLTPSHTLQRH